MLYKLTILSIQHLLEGNTKETLIDLVDMCAALLCFAERSTYIRIQMKEGAQGAQQFDPGYNGVMSLAIQPLHALRMIQGQGSQDLVNPQAGQYSATVMGPGQQIPKLVTFIATQIVQQFYSGQLIPRPQIQQPLKGICMYPRIQQFQGFPQPGLFQWAQHTSGLQYLIVQTAKHYGRLIVVHVEFTDAREPVYINGRLLDSTGTALTRRIAQDLQPLWNKENSQRVDQDQFTPIDPPELTINMTQQQFSAHRDFQAHRSYALRYIGLRSNRQHHRGFEECFLNVSVFIQRHARHEYLTISEWKSFWRELDTDSYLDTVRMELDDDDNHHHHHDHDHDNDHDHRHDRERNGRNDQLDLGRGRKRRRVISSEGQGNGWNNDDWAEDLHREINQNQQPSQRQSLFVTDPNHQFIKGVQQSKYIPIEEAVNHLPLLPEDFKRQVEIKVYTGEQVQYINKMEQVDKFQNMMENMMNKLQDHSNQDEAMRLRMQILSKLSPEEQQRVKRGFGPQIRLTSFYEAQIQRRIIEQNNNAIHIDASWDFGSGTGEQQDEFQNDFIDESQLLEIRPLGKNNKKHKYRKRQRSQKKQRNNKAQTQWYYNNQVLDSHYGPLFGQMNYPGPPWRAPDQSNTKLRSRQPTSRRQWIVPPTQTTPQSKTTPYPNQNQSSILNADLMGIIANPFSVPKGMQHQQIAGKAAQVFHEPRETFSSNGSVRRGASSTYSIASGQVGVAGAKSINIQTAPSTQLQGNPVREPKVEKKGGRTPVRGKATSTNTSVVANQNQSQDQQR
ncbi:MAG: hypothetical protein EZS28_010367 [Streblomastix strix]|uniref:Uncharacterized protein n=1 Tax=Streblomastix strix TaxID=222440 RepID=A0A5J4WIE0_9EUKA|nr:MAG: hypothetical protein EZS28_010367 [Streblomastix strix]